MKRVFAVVVIAACVGCASPVPQAPSSPPPKAIVTDALVRQVAPTGVLRAGINLGNIAIAQKDPRGRSALSGGSPLGVGPDIAREIARRLGVPIVYVLADNAGKLADAANANQWDVALIALDPKRSEQIDSSAAYVQIEGTYLVRAASPARTVADLDREGMRIAAGENTAYTLFLQRTLQHATIITAPTSIAAMDLFRTQGLDAVANVKNPLVEAAARDASLRVIDGNFLVIGHGVGVPKGRPAAARWISMLVEELKASGFVATAIQRSGVADATVAPPAPERR